MLGKEMKPFLILILALCGCDDQCQTKVCWQLEYAVQLTENLVLKQKYYESEKQNLECLNREVAK